MKTMTTAINNVEEARLFLLEESIELVGRKSGRPIYGVSRREIVAGRAYGYTRQDAIVGVPRRSTGAWRIDPEDCRRRSTVDLRGTGVGITPALREAAALEGITLLCDEQ